MTATVRPLAAPGGVVAVRSAAVGTALLLAGGLACLAGHPGVGLPFYATTLLWALLEAGATDQNRRMFGDALALVSLSGLVSLGLPHVLAPPRDQALLVLLAACPLVWLWCAAPTVRSALRLAPPTAGDAAWLLGVTAAGLAVGLAVEAPTAFRGGADALAMTALSLFAPVVDEAVYRGLVMGSLGGSVWTILVAALVQAMAVAAAYPPVVVAAAAGTGLFFGAVRWRTGSWRTALAAHWGLVLGVSGALMVAGW